MITHELIFTFTFLFIFIARSLTSRDVDIYFDDKKEGILYAMLRPGQVVSTNAYPRHEFFVTVAGKKDAFIVRFVVTTDQVRQIEYSIVYFDFANFVCYVTAIALYITNHSLFFCLLTFDIRVSGI